MILKGSQRGGAKDLALHLLKDENEHVEVYRLRGFCSQNLVGALNEAYAVSRGTRCKQFLYSLSLNPPPDQPVSTKVFEDAIEKVERKLGLTGQPCAIVFHEKEGRRHAHAVWSRINTEQMKAVHMHRDREKLMSVSRELFLEHGWQMPEGLVDSKNRDPRNFTLEEWQQARRIGKGPRAIKSAIQDAWAISDSKSAFIHALEERGYKLARGDRRGFVAVDIYGEIYSVPKQVNVKTKAVRERLGDESTLPDLVTVKQQIVEDMRHVFKRFRDKLTNEHSEQKREFVTRRRALVARQRTERQHLKDKHEHRRTEEALVRQVRFRKGLKGLWDRLRGEFNRIKRQNETEAWAASNRDRDELDRQCFRHLEERQRLDIFRLQLRSEYTRERRLLECDIQIFSNIGRSLSRVGPER